MSEIAQFEARKAQLKKQAALRDQILKLSANPDFRDVIDKGFIHDEAARNARIGGDPALSKDQREDALQMAMASGHLQRYLSANIQMGYRADEEIKQIDEALEELRAEEGSEE